MKITRTVITCIGIVLFAATLQHAYADTSAVGTSTIDTRTITPKIIGGTAAAADKYPWATTLLFTGVTPVSDALFCGGSLIGSRWVLTAAHCVSDINDPAQIQVNVGIADLGQVTPSDRIAISAIFTHPDYNDLTLNNDIALLELAVPVNNTTLSLADNTVMQTITSSDRMAIIGWGNMSTTDIDLPSLLQEAEVFLFDFATCNTRYESSPTNPSSLTDNMICAGIPATFNIDTCQGDSGGPMMYNDSAGNWHQTGITSFGEGCALADFPGVYTHVANYISWIDEIISISLPSTINIGYHGIGHTSTEAVVLRNDSGMDINLQSISLTGSSNFSVVSDTCSTGAIPDQAECIITINYSPSSASSHYASLTVSLDAGIKTTRITGTGLNTVDASALDNGFTWYSGGAAAWSSTPAGSASDTAMRSGNIGDNQSSVLLTYISGPATLNFEHLTSTEGNYDFLVFYVDGIRQNSTSGLTNWKQNSVSLGEGEHVISWIYEKDFSDSFYQDSVWLDNVNINGSTGNCGNCGNSIDARNPVRRSSGGSLDLLLLGLLLLPLARKFRLP